MTSTLPLTVISSMATRAMLGELAARHSRKTQQPVACVAAGGVEVARRLRDGEGVDVVVLASNAIDALVTEGKALAERVDLVRSGIAAAVRSGMRRPSLATEEAVKEAIMAARTVSYSTGPSGAHVEAMLERWGVFSELRGRIVVPLPGVAVGSLVADGTVELGFQQLSELLNVAGIDVLGNLPPAVQHMTTFSGAVGAQCRIPGAARTFLAYLASAAAADVKFRHGMEPA